MAPNLVPVHHSFVTLFLPFCFFNSCAALPVVQAPPRAAAVAAIEALHAFPTLPSLSAGSGGAVRTRLEHLQLHTVCEVCGGFEDEQGDLMLLCDGHVLGDDLPEAYLL